MVYAFYMLKNNKNRQKVEDENVTKIKTSISVHEVTLSYISNCSNSSYSIMAALFRTINLFKCETETPPTIITWPNRTQTAVFVVCEYQFWIFEPVSMYIRRDNNCK